MVNFDVQTLIQHKLKTNVIHPGDLNCFIIYINILSYSGNVWFGKWPNQIKVVCHKTLANGEMDKLGTIIKSKTLDDFCLVIKDDLPHLIIKTLYSSNICIIYGTLLCHISKPCLCIKVGSLLDIKII